MPQCVIYIVSLVLIAALPVARAVSKLGLQVEEEEEAAEEQLELEEDAYPDDGGDGKTTAVALAQQLPEGAERLPRLNSVKRQPKTAMMANADGVDFKATLQAVGDRADITHIDVAEEAEAEWNINGGEDGSGDSGNEDEDLRIEGDFEECANVAKESGKEVATSMYGNFDISFGSFPKKFSTPRLTRPGTCSTLAAMLFRKLAGACNLML